MPVWCTAVHVKQGVGFVFEGSFPSCLAIIFAIHYIHMFYIKFCNHHQAEIYFLLFSSSPLKGKMPFNQKHRGPCTRCA